MALENITDMVARAQGRVLEQYRALTTRFVPLLSAFVGEAQEAEDAVWSMGQALLIANAEGVWLDLLGGIVGEPRDGEIDDEVYRRYVQARVLVNKSSGTFEELLEIINLLITDTDLSFLMIERARASLEATFEGDDFHAYNQESYRRRFAKLLAAARMGGVAFMVRYDSVEDVADAFTFAPADTPTASATAGFEDAGTGGRLSTALRA